MYFEKMFPNQPAASRAADKKLGPRVFHRRKYSETYLMKHRVKQLAEFISAKAHQLPNYPSFPKYQVLIRVHFQELIGGKSELILNFKIDKGQSVVLCVVCCVVLPLGA